MTASRVPTATRYCTGSTELLPCNEWGLRVRERGGRNCCSGRDTKMYAQVATTQNGHRSHTAGANTALSTTRQYFKQATYGPESETNELI